MNNQQLDKLVSINAWSIAVQLVILGSVVTGYIVLAREFRALSGRQPVTTQSAMGGGSVEGWERFVRSHDARLGSPQAVVTVLEFTDFQCPYCKRFSEDERDKLLKKYDGKLQFVVKQYPLEAAHPAAKIAAIGALCGASRGRYWDVSRVFYANPTKLNEEYVLSVGKELGMGAEYEACLTEKQTLDQVEQDVQDAQAVGVQGTPTFVVNGRITVGILPTALIDTAIAAAAATKL